MRNVVLTLAVLVLAGCGDPATKDRRGYTKAPLETPGLLIRGEPAGALEGVGVELVPGLTGADPAAVAEDG